MRKCWNLGGSCQLSSQPSNNNVIHQSKLEITNQTYTLTQKNREFIVKIKEWLDKLTDIIKKEKEVNPDEPETMSKIYQKNFLMKEVDSLIRNTEKIELLYEKKST